MSYVRAVPAAQVREVHTAENDVQQELAYVSAREAARRGARLAGFQPRRTTGSGRMGASQPVMLHYAVNRPVGAVRGESDLAPLLRWLSRYSGWLEDRARLNRYRNTFVFTVQGALCQRGRAPGAPAALAANPPAPGSILVTDRARNGACSRRSWKARRPARTGWR